LTNALFWLEVYHIDGLRVDAVASMLYLDYSRKAGEWIPNEFGGRENLEAIAFLKRFNEVVYQHHPDVMTVAEESTAWPMVSRPTYLGGLGFGLKWNMGWMHDTLTYFGKDAVYRRFHHNNLTFSLIYAFQENFVLPFSHDEVVHGKGSMLGKMPGDEWQRFAGLRALYAWMFTHPGKKLLFMGCDFGQVREWSHDRSLDWHLLDLPFHAGLHRFVRDCNTLMRGEPALHQKDVAHDGFQWLDADDAEHSTLSFLRRGYDEEDTVVVAANFTPVPRSNVRLGVPREGRWVEVLNSDAELYGGSGQGNLGGVEATPVGSRGLPCSLLVTLPPLGVVAFRKERNGR
jgi:1,4-alpha-glucan branching enzyme